MIAAARMPRPQGAFALACIVAAGCTGAAEPAWMSGIDDTRSLTALSIPGTHDSGALHEPLAGLAKTQALTIAEQLDAGVRFLDLRARIIDDAFWLYHGSIDQDQAFVDVFATMYAFLDANPTETIIASLKQEAMPTGATRAFDAIFADYVAASPDHWYLGRAIPTLGDARGKIVLVRRFSTTIASPLGIDAAPWADNATFAIDNGDAALRIQDEYIVTDNDAKWAAIEALLAEPGAPSTLYLDYTSGYQPTPMGLPDILAVSNDINARLDTRLATAPDAPRGVLVMDYVTVARIGAVIQSNQLAAM